MYWSLRYQSTLLLLTAMQAPSLNILLSRLADNFENIDTPATVVSVGLTL
jgi:hypothetical protein